MPTSIKLPDWLPSLKAREERDRAAAGLTPKRDGWYKSIDGATRYLFKPMPVADALELVKARVAEIRSRLAGGPSTTVATVGVSSLTLEALAEMYLAWLLERVRTGRPKKMARRTYDDNARVLEKFVDACGPSRLASTIGPADFSRYMLERLAGRAKSTVRREMIYVDAFLKWAGPGRRQKNLIPAVDPGPDWVKPSDDEIATAAADSDKAYSVDDVRRAFARVNRSPMLWAAAHLGLNGAFGPRDIATLPEQAVRLEESLILFPRGKTGVSRMCWLMPNTVQALRAYLEVRGGKCDPTAVGLFFRSRTGLPYARDEVNPDEPDQPGQDYNSVGGQWRKMVGLPFSGLRSTFATLADDWTDQRAVDVVMGHKAGKLGKHIRGKHYAKKFNPERVRLLCEHVWRLAFAITDPLPAPAAPAPKPDAREPRTTSRPATAQGRRGQSATAAGSSPVASHPSPAAPPP